MTTDEFVARCGAACADLALYYAGAPDELFEIALRAFGDGVRDKLTGLFAPQIAPEKIAGVVETMQEGVRARRQELTTARAGRA